MRQKGRIIIKVDGGLGNQMFQYALYRSMQRAGYKMSLDTRLYDTHKIHNGFELTKIFNIAPHMVTSRELFSVIGINSGGIFKIRRKLLGVPKCYIDEKDMGFKYNPQIYNAKKAYLIGYWQTEKYFKYIREEILKDYNVDLSKDIINKDIEEQMKRCNSISIHVRRGDYVSDSENNKIHGNINTVEYYKKAIALICEKVDNPYFYIFSDDIEWVKEKFKLENMMIVGHNIGKDSYKDMILMSKCKHNIIANSSFSWWGAWLNTNTEKIVVAPGKWFNDNKDTSDILPEEWIKIPIN